MRALADWLSAMDRRLMAAPTRIRATLIALTIVAMVIVSLPHVPRSFVDYSRWPWLSRIQQPDTYGTDTISETYVARVVVNGLNNVFTTDIISLMFEIALVVLLLHPQSREYERIWFK